ncbi:pyrrolo-quinoline quinone [Eubacteriales bacterium OttesenSCG-928-K08]|nr:pyrrolo-quinoline quinone [Eubacteriales bacterium OttesenSCG-928-K08]
MARRGKRGRQTKARRRHINWGRLLMSAALLAGVVAVVVLVINLLTPPKGDEDNIFTGLFGGKPTPTPTIGVEVLPGATGTPAPTPTPRMAQTIALSPAEGTDPSAFGFNTQLMIDRQEVSSFTRSGDMRFGSGDEYTSLKGIITFGGNNYRNTFTYGTQTLEKKTLERIWEIPISSLDGWTGVGWTGMPIIVEWPEETRKILGIKDEFKQKDGFVEVIYPTLDGNIYFIELESGKQTRDPLKLGVVTKGTASLDPRGYPLLYTGQGISSTEKDGSTGAWFRIINLITNEVIARFGGKDPFSYRAWQAYDSSILVNAATDTIIAPGENGVLYTLKLNSSYDPAAGTVSVSPGNLEKYKYTGTGYGGSADDNSKRWVGIENSVSVFRNYVYFTDNGGRMQCVDLNTLELQFVVDVTDDSDTSPVLEEDPANGTYYLYTANEVDKQEGAATLGVGKSYHRKIDGRTGAIIWQVEWEASIGSTSSNGGTLSTPHVGRGKLKDIVIYNSTIVPVTYIDENGQQKSGNGGRIVAYNKHDGTELWRYEQAGGYWSSPVVVYDKEGNGYLIQCDRSGRMRIHDPLDGGKVLFDLDMGSRIEATPAVFGDYLVVGTRGTNGSGEGPKIVGVKIN